VSLLAIDGLRLTLAGRDLLDGVSLGVDAGEVVALVGPSGSGKSMTALAVAGLPPPGARLAGRVLLAGRDLMALPERAMTAVRGAEVGLVFQEPATALNPLMRARDQVAELFAAHGRASCAAARAAAEAALAAVGLAGLGDRYPHQLSGGQRQRVAIAIATALQPRLVIADEATSALDVLAQAEVLGLLARAARQGGAGLLLITHDLAVAGRWADRIAVIDAGRIVEEGPAQALLAAPAHAVTRALRDAFALGAAAPGPAAAGGPSLLAGAALVRRHPLPRAHPFAPRRSFAAVDHVSLSIAPGAALGVVGASGSGKSTLLRMLAGLERPDAGAVTLAGAPFPAADRATLRAQRRRLQIVFQDPGGSLDPVWSAGRSVAEPLGLIDPPPAPAERAALATAALARVGLPADTTGRRPHAFSGGQRQRIAIARAIVVRPDLLLLDEAVSALDALSRAQVLALVAQLRRELGLALLFVSHDLAVIRAACEQVAVMDAGRIVEAGPTAEVLARPAHPVTRALVAATPALDPAPETPA
jgi:peptide/nickel transport system ATP-binding protein